MSKTAIILFFILFASCNKLVDSKGEFNEIIIIVSNEDRNSVEEPINQLLSEYVNTPIEEPLYKLKWIEPENFTRYLDFSNLFFISLDSPSDSTIDLLVDKFIYEYDKDIFLLNDIYANNQHLIFFQCDSLLDFQVKIKKYGNWITDSFEENIKNNILKYLEQFNRDRELEELIYSIYKKNIRIQEDYLLIKQDELNNFIWIGRGYPYRWLTFMAFEDFVELDEIWNKYEEMLNQNMPNVNISEYYKNILFDSDNSIKIQGLYEEEISETGGPFFSYIFYSESLEKMIAISGFVNNPGKPKNRLLRELETIVEEIKSEDNYE